MKHRKVRWGILGTANIARKNWKAIALSGNSIVSAVASRDLARSKRFVASRQSEVPMASVPQALGSYDELINSKEVDAIYMPLPTALRKEWVLRAAAAGKHVICEKPCAVSTADLKEMLNACRRNRVQFMDGVMFMHSRRFIEMRTALDDRRAVGQLRRIASAFSFHAEPEFFRSNIRADGLLEPDGCLGDLGWYCIRLALWVMEWQMPREVTGRILAEVPGANSTRVPVEFSGELFFDRGVSSSFFCSFLAENHQGAYISGTRGYLELPDFVLPFNGSHTNFTEVKNVFTVRGCDFKMESRQRQVRTPEYSQGHRTAQEVNMFRDFSRQVLSGKLNEEWPEIALKTQQVMEDCLKSALRHPKNAGFVGG
jgi:predicted dehydrogenase